MIKKRIKLISDIKTVEDLQRLKLELKYKKDLKKMELQASIIQLESELSPEAIKQTFVFESQSYFKRMAVNYLPSFVLNFLYKSNRQDLSC